MPSSQKITIESVNSLKSSLQKHSTSDVDIQCLLDILARLDELPINLPILKETLIAKAVNVNICKKANLINSNTDVLQRAKSLISKWKSVAKASGVVTVQATAPTHTHKSTSKSTSDEHSKSNTTNNNNNNNIEASLKKKSSPNKLTRQDSSSSDIQDHHWKNNHTALPPIRRNICEKLMHTLSVLDSGSSNNNINIPKEILLELCASRAEEIESRIHAECDCYMNKAGYTTKARQLAFNLKKNAPLREKVVMGIIPSHDLVSMSIEELATIETRKERDKLVKEVSDSRRLDWDQANEKKINEICGIKGELLKASLFTCGRCKSIKTTSTQKQTRSADEPMTVFVWCMNCGNRWKC